MKPVVITAAVVGAEVTRQQTPHIPITPAEIADAALQAHAAGAAMVHLHGRLPDGTATQDGAVFADIIRRIRQQAHPLIQVSTGGAVGMTAEERLQPAFLEGDVKPDMVTFSLGSVNFGDGVFLNPPQLLETFAQLFRERGLKPELEIFDSGMLATAHRFIKKGLLKPPLHFDFVLGMPGGMAGTVKDLQHLVDGVPEGCSWSVAGVGAAQLTLATAALAMGGHVRVGLEDNIFYRKGELATGSDQLVARIVRIARELDRAIATPDLARELLHLD